MREIIGEPHFGQLGLVPVFWFGCALGVGVAAVGRAVRLRNESTDGTPLG